mmetsp:Transcript_3508/g.11712  ORF Transcript_3508/g.11712 Transcript_3508/m.11712 type:complete len:204 (+) Transcript_3508:650-1261(+)
MWRATLAQPSARATSPERGMQQGAHDTPPSTPPHMELSGPSTRATSPNTRKSRPPMMATLRSEMLAASMRPPMTARPVHRAWPRVPPRVTPKGSFAAESAMVAIWERSPHSARKVSVKDCTKACGSHAFLRAGSLARPAVSRSLPGPSGPSSSFLPSSASTSSSSSLAPPPSICEACGTPGAIAQGSAPGLGAKRAARPCVHL